MNLVPLSSFDEMAEYPLSSFEGMAEYSRPLSVPTLTCPGQARCIYILFHPDINVDETADAFERWFDGRDEIRIVDVGTTDKANAGFIVLEWRECDIDPLFIAILKDQQSVMDFTLYGRFLEGNQHGK